MRRERYAKVLNSPLRSEHDPVFLRWEMWSRLAWLWATAVRLPMPPNPRGLVPGAPPGACVVGFGDSIAAGVGVESQADGLLARFSGEIAAGRAIHWESFAVSGATADVLDPQIERAGGAEADYVLLSCGVNDVLRSRPLGALPQRDRPLPRSGSAPMAARAPRARRDPVVRGLPGAARPAGLLPRPTGARLRHRGEACGDRRGSDLCGIPGGRPGPAFCA